MSIVKFIEQVCQQDAVYWQFTGIDGFNTPQFEDPVDIKVRWDEKTEIISDNDGKEYISRAQIVTPNDLVEQSYIRLGTVEDLPNEDEPRDITGAFEIKKMDRFPLFKSTTLDVFMAYL